VASASIAHRAPSQGRSRAAASAGRVLYRKDFGTPAGWREVRGVQVAELPRPLGDVNGAAEPTGSRTLVSWYFDRLGKLEKLRRQVYSLTLTPYAGGLWLGLLTVIEWPKQRLDQERGADAPALDGDTTNIYLVTSRDGVHIDDDFVYAHQARLSPRRGTARGHLGATDHLGGAPRLG